MRITALHGILPGLLALTLLPLTARAGDKMEDLTTVEYEQTLAEGIDALHIATRVGSIEVLPFEKQALHIEAIVKVNRKKADHIAEAHEFKHHVTVQPADHVLKIMDAHKDAPDHEAWAVSLKVYVPRTVSITATSGAGQVDVQVTAGDLELTTGAGNVILSSEHTGAIQATTGAGSVKLNLAKVTGPIEATTGAGNVKVKLSGSGAQDNVALSSGTGNVALHLPAGAGGTFDVGTGIGSISVKNCPGIKVKRSLLGAAASGQLGEHGPSYDLGTGTGSISLVCE